MTMEYRIAVDGPVNVAAIDEALRGADPAALVDVDINGSPLRVSTSLGRDEVASLLTGAGVDTAPAAVEQQPSTCCGGCGG
jgi:hypothetical protein